MSRRSSFRSFPSIHALTLGLAAGTFALLSGYEGRVALGAETPMGRIIGIVGDGAVVPTAVPAAVPAGSRRVGSKTLMGCVPWPINCGCKKLLSTARPNCWTLLRLLGWTWRSRGQRPVSIPSLPTMRHRWDMPWRHNALSSKNLQRPVGPSYWPLLLAPVLRII